MSKLIIIAAVALAIFGGTVAVSHLVDADWAWAGCLDNPDC